MKRFIKSKKGIALLATLAALAIAGGAYAYFTSNGSGQGAASVGTSASLKITQTNTISGLLPNSVSQPVAYTIDNTAQNFAQNLGNVTVSDISVDQPFASNGCMASWFTPNNPTSAVGTIPASSTYTSVAGTEPSIQMNESGGNQDACKGATLTLTLTAAQGS